MLGADQWALLARPAGASLPSQAAGDASPALQSKTGGGALPFDTPTPTETAAPGQTVMLAHVSLLGRGNPPGSRWSVPITITMRLTSGGPLSTFSGTTDTSG